MKEKVEIRVLIILFVALPQKEEEGGGGKMSEGGRTPVKHAPTLEEMKSKRLEKASELRMRKRDHHIRQRRKISMNNDDEDEEEGSSSSSSSSPFVPSSSVSSSPLSLPPRPLSDFRQDLYSDDPVRVVGACTQFRMRLSGLRLAEPIINHQSIFVDCDLGVD